MLHLENGGQLLKCVGGNIICICTICLVCSISWGFNDKDYKRMHVMITITTHRPILILYTPCTMFYTILLLTNCHVLHCVSSTTYQFLLLCVSVICVVKEPQLDRTSLKRVLINTKTCRSKK